MVVEDRSRLTSKFGKRDIDHGPNDHWGLDFGGPSAGISTYVKAAADGTVAWIKNIPLRSGLCIGIKHPDGTLTNYVHTRYHKVKVGQKVRRGEVIAETWTTGLRGGTEKVPSPIGIHLHFEWWNDWTNHRSVFDPTDRLADYGWALKWDAQAGRSRMCDEWEGRPTKTPVTIQHASTSKPAPAVSTTPTPAPVKDWFTMATEADLRKIVREEAAKAVWNHELTLPRSNGAKTTTGAIHASDYVNNRESYALAKEIARELGMSETRILEAIQNAERNIGAAVEKQEA